MQHLKLTFVILTSIAWAFHSLDACNPPAVPAGSTWISNVGCIQASTGTLLGAFCNGTTRCHCSNQCGYLCSTDTSLCPATTTTPTTTSPTKATTTTTPAACTGTWTCTCTTAGCNCVCNK